MDQLVAEFPRRIHSMGLVAAFGLIGLALSIAGAITADSPETARTGLLLGFGALGLIAAIAMWIDIARKRKAQESITIFEDRVRIRKSGNVVEHKFSELRALEAKIIVVQQSGARLHAYRLCFASDNIELHEGDFLNVGAATGPLLMRAANTDIRPWL